MISISYGIIQYIISKLVLFKILITLIYFKILIILIQKQQFKQNQMNCDLLLQTLNIITDKYQSSFFKIIRKNKSITDKLTYASLFAYQFKSQILQWLQGIFKNYNHKSSSLAQTNFKNMNNLLSQLKIKQHQHLSKHKLHMLLKNKLKKLKNQSFLHSLDRSYMNSQIDQNNKQFKQFQDHKINDLQKSVIQIQKDLNIYENDQFVHLSKINTADQDAFNISSIIQRSRIISRQYQPKYNQTKKQQFDQHNVSLISQYSEYQFNSQIGSKQQRLFGTVHENIQYKQAMKPQKYYQQNDQIQKSNQKIDDKYNEEHNRKNNEKVFIKNRQNNTQVIKNQQIFIEQQQGAKFNQNCQQISDNTNPFKLKTNISQQIVYKKSVAVKKKKKIIYTNNGSSSGNNSITRQGLFQNLLEQSYQQTCSQSNLRQSKICNQNDV